MGEIERSERNATYIKVVRQAWNDPIFKAKLLADPRAALASLGAILPEGLTIKVVENTENLTNVVLPLQPAGSLSGEKVAAATGFFLESASGEGPLFMPFCVWCSFCLDLVAKAWSEPAFKAKLLADPLAALIEAGTAVREGESVNVFENSDTLVHLILPSLPAGELSDEALQAVAAGATGTSCWIALDPRTNKLIFSVSSFL